VVIKGDLPEKLKQDAEMYAGCVSGAVGLTHYLNLIKENGFAGILTHKEKEIKLPESVLAKYFAENELYIFHSAGSGIYSITVSANKE
jgi:hypothetical protein